MANERNPERDEPQRTSTDEERIRGVGEQDDEFDEETELDEEEADEEDETI